jgi:hypothetical protein
MSIVSRLHRQHKEMTGAALAAHEAALKRHRDHRAKLKAEREARDAQATADIVHQNEDSAAGL